MTPAPGLRLMAVVAHPDDECLGMGGTLAHYAAEGIEVHVVTATRGERGRFYTPEQRPGLDVVGATRERELHAAAHALGVHEVHLLGYMDGDLDRADAREATSRLVARLRRVRPQVVLTFDPLGAYGHPDHIAISQLTTTAIVAAADGSWIVDGDEAPPHRVAKLYYLAWDEVTWTIFQRALKRLVSLVDGEERQATPWPSWAITTRIDARAQWDTVWRAVQCHETQMTIYGPLGELTRADHERLWGTQSYYRAMSWVNGGREMETDLFAGLR